MGEVRPAVAWLLLTQAAPLLKPSVATAKSDLRHRNMAFHNKKAHIVCQLMACEPARSAQNSLADLVWRFKAGGLMGDVDQSIVSEEYIALTRLRYSVGGHDQHVAETDGHFRSLVRCHTIDTEQYSADIYFFNSSPRA